MASDENKKIVFNLIKDVLHIKNNNLHTFVPNIFPSCTVLNLCNSFLRNGSHNMICVSSDEETNKLLTNVYIIVSTVFVYHIRNNKENFLQFRKIIKHNHAYNKTDTLIVIIKGKMIQLTQH